MNLIRRQVICMLLLGALGGGSCLAGERFLIINPADWQFSRTWKSAHDGKGGGARYHFYTGSFGLTNVSQKEVQQVSVTIRVLDPAGKKINETETIGCGNLAPGRRIKKAFSMDRAVQFSELLLRARFEVEGQKREVEFSSPDGSCPKAIAVDATGAVNELRILSHDIDRPILGKKKGKATLIIRVRNLSAVPASKPVVKLVFNVKNSSKRSKHKSKSKSKSEPQADPSKHVVEIVLDEGEIAPGATKVYEKRLPHLPEFHGYGASVSATWPDPKEKTTKQVTVDETTGEGDKVVLGELTATKTEDGSTVLSMAITNNGEDIAAGTFKLKLVLTDAKGKTMKKIEHTCSEALPKGKTVMVKLPPQKLPAYAGYEVGMEF